MNTSRATRVFGMTLGAAVVATSSLTAPASAGFFPALELHVSELTTGYNQTFMPSGTAGPLFYNYGIGINTSSFGISGDINASPDLPGPSPALLSTSLAFTNSTSQTLEFIVTMKLPMSTGMTAVQWNTSASWVLTGPSSGAQLQTLENMPLWAVYIDSTEVASLYDHPSGMGGSGSGPYHLNTDPKSGAFGPVEESISIQLAFSLSAQATGGPTGGFTLIPAPGVLALMAAGWLIGGPRRRRS